MKSQLFKVGSNFVTILYEPNYTRSLAGCGLLSAVDLKLVLKTGQLELKMLWE